MHLAIVSGKKLTFHSFNTRHYKSKDGLKAAEWLFEEVKKVVSVNPAILVRQFSHKEIGIDQPSIIVQLPGNQTDLGTQVLLSLTSRARTLIKAV